nr:hypothetical protein [Kibdelosporangium sp. MJ126-NF4]
MGDKPFPTFAENLQMSSVENTSETATHTRSPGRETSSEQFPGFFGRGHLAYDR